MSALESLARLLAPLHLGADEAPVDTAHRGLDDAIARLSVRASAGHCHGEPADLQADAVRRFWHSGRLASLRDARLAAFGIGLAAGPDGARLLDDRTRFDALLAALDAWRPTPHAYRRCYQGLLRSYFAFEPAGATDAARAQWQRLRAYLGARAPATRGAAHNPDWVLSLARHPSVFGEAPGADLVERLLAGDRGALDALCAQWGIAPASWFPQALTRAQVDAATQCDHDAFIALLPRVLALLRDDDPWRDEGLSRLLERHAQIPKAPAHAALRDAVGAAWACPWQAAASPRWERLSDAARSRAADWLKADLIERFCARVTDGSGPRRAAFWTRFTASMQDLAITSADDAMVFTIGGVQLVTFAAAAEPVYGYDVRRARRFDTTRPLAIASGADADADLQLHHRDGVDGWREWEQSFTAALTDRFALRLVGTRSVPREAFVDLSDDRPLHAVSPVPSAPATDWLAASAGEDVHWHTAEAGSVPYSRTSLEVLARVHHLTLGSDPDRPGSVTVGGAGLDRRIERILSRWGFAETGPRCWSRAARALARAA